MKAYFNRKKKEIENRQIEELYINAGKTAFLTIDMHEAHLSTDPDCPSPAPRGRELIDPINAFSRICRKRGIPVVHIKSSLRTDGSDDIHGNISAWRLIYPETGGSLPNADEYALEGSKWSRFSIDVKENDYVISGKKRFSAFYPTDLEFLLRNLHKEILVISGIATNCCILSTVLDAVNRDFRVLVPQDLTRGDTYEMEQNALEMISTNMGLVVDSADLAEAWNSSGQIGQKKEE